MECVQAISLPGPASALAVDDLNRVLIIAAQNNILYVFSSLIATKKERKNKFL